MEKENKIARIQQGDENEPLARAFARTKHNFSNNSTLDDTGSLQRITKKRVQVTKDINHTPINFYTFDTRVRIIASGVISYAYKVLKITEIDNSL